MKPKEKGENRMPKKKIENLEPVFDLMQKILIVILSKEGVSQNDIASIVGVATRKVNSILKLFNKPSKINEKKKNKI